MGLYSQRNEDKRRRQLDGEAERRSRKYGRMNLAPPARAASSAPVVVGILVVLALVAAAIFLVRRGA